MKVAIYARVSTKEQSPDAQVDELRKYCEQREWHIVGDPIVDHGYTGGNDERPGIKKLYLLAQTKQIDGIVVTKLDRLFRSLRHFVFMTEELQSYGTTLTCTKDPVDYSTHTGRMFVQLLAVLAEFERGMIKERMLSGIAWAQAQGTHCGRPIGGGGKRHRTRPDDEIIELYLEGRSRMQIANELSLTKSSVTRAIKSYEENK